MSQIPITSLTPSTPPAPNTSIRAIITLSWPYSSSTRQCALLLADPDFRLRHHKGQVRVRFTGASAQAVAQSRVGIGDEIVLSLEGAVWGREDEGVVRTPGRSVEGELLFGRRLGMRIVKADAANVDINVDAPVSPPRAPSPERDVQMDEQIVTPLPRDVWRLRAGFDGTSEKLPSYTFASPAFAKRLRLDGESFLDSAYDPFVSTDAGGESSKGADWTSFGRKLNWRYSEKTPSPKKVHFEHDGAEVEAREEMEGLSESITVQEASPSRDLQATKEMLPPPLPRLTTTTSENVLEERQPAEDSVELQEGPSTPKLQPVGSPTLPLPSPFPTEIRKTSFETTTSPDQRQISSILTQGQSQEVIDIVQDQGQSQDVVMLDREADLVEENAITYQSDTEPDDEATQKLLMDRHGVSAEVEDDTPIEHPHEIPSTPERNTRQPQRLELGLDGANSAPTSAQVTPQSEKERIMAQTYRSLFGFQDSTTTSPTQPQPPPQPFSDLAWGRLQAAGIDTSETHKRLEEELIKTPVPIAEEEIPSSPEQAPSVAETTQPPPPPPSSRPEQIEVIDLDSSSEDEDEPLQEQAPIPPAPQRRMPQLEVQDSMAESEAEDLPAQSSRSQQTGSRAPQRGREVSKLQTMVEESISEPPKLAPAIELESRMEGEADVLQEGEPSLSRATGPPGIPETPSTAFHGAPVQADETQIIQAISPPLMSPPAWLSEAAGPLSEDLFGDSVEQVLQAHQSLPETQMQHEIQPVSTTTRATVIDLDATSPVLQASMSPVQGKSTSDAVLEKLDTAHGHDHHEPIEVLETSPQELQSEFQLKSPSLPDGSQPERIRFESQNQDSNLPSQQAEIPSYPSLPLSPSYSQSVSEMASQPAAGMVSATLTSVLPPTPQLTQVESFTEARVPAEDVSFNQVHNIVEPSTQPQQAEEEVPTPKLKKKTPARKSLNTRLSDRLSDVPAVISPWFSPKSASVAAEKESGKREMEEQDNDAVESLRTRQANGASQYLLNGQSLVDSEPRQAGALDINGFSTSLSYFTPLSKLEELLNPSSQQAYGTNTIDVLAVVTDATNLPVRAKAGPRDYFTLFKISDQSVSGQSGFRVEIYRPWMATLPIAAVGDVVLLRAFAVKSRKRQPYLLSTDASAWCVWRYENGVSEDGDDGRPIWAQKQGSAAGGVREEVKGPPVELGDEERTYASNLREWWEAFHGEDVVDQSVDDTQHDPTLHGRVAQSVSANL